MELTQHPLSAAFPSMSAEDFQALKDDIETNGQREPVQILDGMVLDGWHRYRACVELGLKPLQFTYGGGDPAAFVESANLHRRHLSASQRAVAVVKVRAWAPAGKPQIAAQKSNVATVATLPTTNAVLAREAKVSPRTIRDAKVTVDAGLDEIVRDGGMTVDETAAVARGTSPKKATPKAKRELPTQPPPDADDSLAEAQHTITELADENEKLRDKLAVESLMDSETAKTQTAETIRELRALVKTLEAENAALKVSRDTYMRESAEAKKSVIYWRNKAEKAAKDNAA